MKQHFKFMSLAVLSMILVSLVSTPANASTEAQPRTQTSWNVTSEDGVDVIPYVRVDKKAIFVDFEHADFNNIEYIYYNLNYNTDEKGTIRGVEGSFTPDIIEPTGHFGGKPYYRRLLVLGTCSQMECSYHSRPRDITLTVNTKMKSGLVEQYTKVITISDSQFN